MGMVEVRTPQKVYVKRAELLAWLSEVGYTPWRVRCLIESGTIPSHVLKGYKWARRYKVREVVVALELGGF